MNRRLLILLATLGILLAATLALILSYQGREQQRAPLKPAPAILLRLLRQAEQLRAEGKYQEAERRLQQLIKFEPDYPRALLQLGVLYFEQERYRESELLFRNLISRNRFNPILYNNLGQPLVRQHNYPAGIRALLRARELAPEMEIISLNLAAAYEAAGDEENAGKYFNEFNAIRLRHQERAGATQVQTIPADAGEKNREQD